MIKIGRPNKRFCIMVTLKSKTQSQNSFGGGVVNAKSLWDTNRALVSYNFSYNKPKRGTFKIVCKIVWLVRAAEQTFQLLIFMHSVGSGPTTHPCLKKAKTSMSTALFQDLTELWEPVYISSQYFTGLPPKSSDKFVEKGPLNDLALVQGQQKLVALLLGVMARVKF